MKTSVRSLVYAVAFGFASVALAEESTWFDEPGTAHWTNSSGNNKWVDPNNWKEGKVPGRFWTSKDGEILGCLGCTAVFGKDCQNFRDYVDLNGLRSIAEVRFEDAVEGSFKMSNGESPAFPLEQDGRVYVAPEVAYSPVIAGQIAASAGYTGTGQIKYTLENDSQVALVVNSVGSVKDYRGAFGWTTIVPTLKGAGQIQRNAHFYASGWSISLNLAQSGGTYFANCGTQSAQNGYGGITTLADSGCQQKVSIPSGKYLYLANNGQWSAIITANEDLLIGGEGTLRVNADAGWPVQFTVTAGKTIRIECPVESYNGSNGYQFYDSGDGVLEMWGNYAPSGNPTVNTATLRVPRFGMAGAASPLGTGDGVKMSGGRLSYAGEGETTDRVLNLTKASTLEQKGTGDLVFTAVPSGSAALTIANNGSTAAIGFATSVSVPLVLAANSRLAAVKGESGELTFSSVALTSGANVLSVGADVELMVSALTGGSSAATLDVTGAGSVKIAGLQPGLAPSYITRNGKAARVTASGVLAGLDDDDRKIDARGDVIPDAPVEIVAITSAEGEEGTSLSLEKDETGVMVLRQRETVEPAKVVVGDGQTFSPQMIEVVEGAAPVILSGAGEVSPFVLKGDGVIRTNETDGVGVRLASEAGATVALGGALTAADPLSLRVTQGRATLTGSADVPAAPVSVMDGGELVLDGAGLYQPGLGMGSSTVTQGLFVGTNGNGRLTVESGSYTGSLVIAKSSGQGAVYQKGGEVVSIYERGGEPTSGIGWGAYGCYELTGGRFLVAGHCYVGRAGEGVLTIHGGTLTCPPSSVRKMEMLVLGGWEAEAVVNVARGGRIDFSDSGAGAGAAAILAPYYGRYRAGSVFSVEKGGEVNLGSSLYYAGESCDEVYNPIIVNLNDGGVFIAHSIIRPRKTVYPDAEFTRGGATDPRYANCPVYVNFNGGTFRPTNWVQIFGTTGGDNHPPTRITVFEKGATIDAAGVDPELGPGSGLKAPGGNGIAAVELSDAVRAMTFLGSPYVKIAGDGRGASAYADFDSASGKVTGIHVTSPGWDYGSAEAQVIVGGKTLATLPVSLKANVSGGLVKTGSGTLKVVATNTYTGATCLKSGRILLQADDVFSASSPLVLDGGTLDLDGHAQTFADITCNGGTVVNGTVGVTGLTVDFNAAVTGTVKKVDTSYCTFAPGTPVTVPNYDASLIDPAARHYVLVVFSGTVPDLALPTLALPEGWSLKLSGNRLRIAKDSGLLLIVK